MSIELKFTPPSWWLEAIVALDSLSPGLAGALMRTSHHRRQASAAVLATCRTSFGHGIGFTDTAVFETMSPLSLVTERLEALVSNAYGTCPRPFLKMLDRMGADIAPPSVYCQLFDIYSNSARATVAEALRVVNQPTSTMLAVALDCPAWLLKAGALPLLKSNKHRDDFIAAVELIKEVCPSADQRTLSASLRACVQAGHISRFVEKWLLRAVFEKPDFPLDGAFALVPSAKELARLARRFSNCAAKYRVEVLAGLSMFLRYQAPQGEFIVHLQRPANGCQWEYAGTHSPRNDTTPYLIREDVEKRMRNMGIIVRREYLQVPDRWKVIERLSVPFEDDLETLLFGP